MAGAGARAIGRGIGPISKGCTLLRASFLALFLSVAPAWTQQAPEAGVVRAYLEGCLESSAGMGAAASRDFCKCTAKAIFSEDGQPADAWMQCQPGLGEILGGD